MESSSYHGPTPVSHGVESRPSLGFPLGTALLLLVIFSLSGIFSCCYHWDKLRRTFSLYDPYDLEAGVSELDSPSKSSAKHTDLKQQKNQSLPVIMPGDNIAKFIAMPCPCEPLRQGTVVVEVIKLPPPKPPRIAVPYY